MKIIAGLRRFVIRFVGKINTISFGPRRESQPFLISFARSFDSATTWRDVYRKHKVFIILHRRFVSFETSDNNVALIRVRCQTAASMGTGCNKVG